MNEVWVKRLIDTLNNEIARGGKNCRSTDDMTNEDALNHELTQEKLAELARFLKVLPERVLRSVVTISRRASISLT